MTTNLCKKLLSAVLSASVLSGCGTLVPEVQEFWGTEDDNVEKVNAIVGQIACEIGQAVRKTINFDRDKRNSPRALEFLEKWGVQVTLTLIVEEKTTLNPGVSLNTPMHNSTTNFAGEFIPSGASSALAAATYPFLSAPQSYSFGIGGKLAADALRTDKLNFLYKVSDFLEGGPHWQDGRIEGPCLPDAANATLFIQSDLKIAQWMRTLAAPARTGTGTPDASGTNGITHDIKFIITTDGNITPTWKLVRASANTSASNPLFGVSRERTQEVLITLGPLKSDRGTGGNVVSKLKGTPPILSLADRAASSHLAEEIGSAVGAATRPQ
jgi:hypothetical protein